ncbi:MAG: SDR family NAD(P)-dependent oxidoreductase [Planctomycetota bacterium]
MSTATLQGRLALVTGAGRGIGLALSLALAERGTRLLLVGRDARRLQDAATACRRAGASQVDISLRDLSNRGALEALCGNAAQQADILINNAGIAPTAALERSDDALWERTMALNAFAPFALCRAAVPAMVGRGYGRIVNLGSTAGLRGFAFTSAYTASKHALVGLTRALDAELRQRHPAADVTVNALCPGFVDTELLRPSLDRLVAGGLSEAEARERLGSLNRSGRLLLPADVAAAALRLIEEVPGRTRGAAVELDDAAS